MTTKAYSFPEFCGRRGERGVCVRPRAHDGACETVRCEPIHLTQAEKEDRRFLRVAGDLFFALKYVANRKESA